MVNLKSKLKQAQKQRGALLVMNLVIIALCLVLFGGTVLRRPTGWRIMCRVKIMPTC